MDKALGLMLLAEKAIRLPPGGPSPREDGLSRARRDFAAEDESTAGILWSFVQARRGTPPSGR